MAEMNWRDRMEQRKEKFLNEWWGLVLFTLFGVAVVAVFSWWFITSLNEARAANQEAFWQGIQQEAAREHAAFERSPMRKLLMDSAAESGLQIMYASCSDDGRVCQVTYEIGE